MICLRPCVRKLMCRPTDHGLGCRLSIKVIFGDWFCHSTTGWGNPDWILFCEHHMSHSRGTLLATMDPERNLPHLLNSVVRITWLVHCLSRFQAKKVFNYSRKPVLYHWRWFNRLLFGCSTNGTADKINKLFLFTPN